MDEHDIMPAEDLAEGQQDDLETISGIGPKFADALRAVGIRRYTDLADYKPEELSEALMSQAGIRVPSDRIETNHWIDQARELAWESSEHSSPRLEAEPGEGRRMANQPKHTRQHAGFSLFFDYIQENQAGRIWQTRVYHEESGKESLFAGTATRPWLEWILQRADLPGEVPGNRRGPDLAVSATTETAAGTVPLQRVEPGDVSLEIPDLELEKVQVSAATGGEALQLRVRFRVSGPDRSQLAERRVQYRLEIHTVDPDRGMPRLAASSVGRLEPSEYQYERTVMFEVPEPGRYGMYCMVLLPPPRALMGFRQGPNFRVVP